MSFAEAASFMRRHERFLISSHVNPDGDGIGAAMGVKWALEKLGKESQIVLDSAPPEIFSFFAAYDWVKSVGALPVQKPFDFAVLVDSPNMERIGRAASLLSGEARILNLDHHISNEYFGSVNLVEPDMSSSAEMVYHLIRQLELEPDPDCAEYLYTGMVIDTGRFRFSNTKAQTLMAAARLLEAGARPDKITENIYERNTFETTRALARFLESIQLYFGGQVAIGCLEHEFIASETYQFVETEGFVNHALSIKGVAASAFMREVEPGRTRASLRSRGKVDVNALAGTFGGGGHERAAGCTIHASLEDAKTQLLSRMEQLLNS